MARAGKALASPPLRPVRTIAAPLNRRRFFVGADAAVCFRRQPAARFSRHRCRRLRVLLFFEDAEGVATWIGPTGTWVNQPFEGAHVWIVPANTLHAVSLDVEVAMVVLDVEPSYVREITSETLSQVSLEPMSPYLQADSVITALVATFAGYCRKQTIRGRRCVVNEGATLVHHLLAVHLAPREHVRTLQRGLAPSMFSWAKKQIEDNMIEGVSFSKIAREAGISLAHFSRMFKASAGCSPEEYLNNLRTQKAVEVLQSGECKSITDAAHAVGCYDHSHLNKLMRRKFDLPAGAFFRKKAAH